MKEYVIGIDFGSLSGRGAVVRIKDGHVLKEASMSYPHGIMDTFFLNEKKLPVNWALQHPQDFLDVLTYLFQALTKDIDCEEIAGIGLDCTGSSILPIDKNGQPLCFKPEFSENPYAYIMMWKHHAAQPYADKMRAAAAMREEPWLAHVGGNVEAEWFFPKLMQICIEAPELYNACDAIVEAGDWLVELLTGKRTKSKVTQTAKAFYYEDAFPDEAFFAQVSEKIAHCVSEKVTGSVLNLGSCAGTVTREAAQRFHIPEGIPVSVSSLDGTVCQTSCGITEAGKMLGIIGTSAAYFVMNKNSYIVPGICGDMPFGLLPDYIMYEAGQSSAGDILGWYCNCMSTKETAQEAEQAGLSLQAYLTKKAEKLCPGESGLIALDWFNGNRSILCNSRLSGIIVGMTIHTKPEEIYRALLESIAFGARMIVENFNTHGVDVNELIVTGGIPLKNPLLMQIYADVLRMPIRVIPTANSSTLGSAVLAALASGSYASPKEAINAMNPKPSVVYLPKPENKEAYEALWQEYKTLHNTFGKAGGPCERLHKIQQKAKNDL